MGLNAGSSVSYLSLRVFTQKRSYQNPPSQRHRGDIMPSAVPSSECDRHSMLASISITTDDEMRPVLGKRQVPPSLHSMRPPLQGPLQVSASVACNQAWNQMNTIRHFLSLSRESGLQRAGLHTASFQFSCRGARPPSSFTADSLREAAGRSVL